MINAVIYKDKNGVIHGFSIEGHAGYSKKGKDIVCSAVSMITINTINSIDTLTNENTAVETDSKVGYIKCSLPERKQGKSSLEADILLKSMILGLKSLKDEYGKYIELSEECVP